MFRSDLVLKADKKPGVWVVAEPLFWVPKGEEIDGCTAVIVPVGTMTDLASVPTLVQNIPFLDPTGRSRRAAVLHDYLYRGGKFQCGRRPSRAEADKVLRLALRAERCTRWVSTVFWLGVRAGGWAAWSH